MKNKRFETAQGLPQYFQALDKLEGPMSKQEEQALALRIQAGDDAALHSLVQANLKFVVTLANKFIGMGLPIDDLIQEGNAGLIEAARKFTAEKDVKFITYAQFWIRKRLNLSLCEYGRTVRIPVNQEYDIYKRKMKGEDINLSNIALDKPIGEDGDNTLGDIMCKTPFADPFEKQEETMIINKLLSTLKDSDREIVELFYGLVGDGMPTKDIAEQVGKTPAEVNRALNVARAKMRQAVNQ